jgi:tRNA threonylcarbamoyladenosine biosynthesis protein TsaB
MMVLGLEAATAAGSVALLDEEALRGEFWMLNPKTHSERILKGIDHLLKGCSSDLHDLQGIAVGLGPGSFTGLRIALSTAKGLAFSLGIPMVGVSTLEAMASAVPYWPENICPLIDARGGYAYGAVYRQEMPDRLKPVIEQDVRELAAWLELLSATTLFLGSGAVAYREAIVSALGHSAHFAPQEAMHPRAAIVARLGLQRLLEGQADEPDAMEPLYMGRSQAAQ